MNRPAWRKERYWTLKSEKIGKGQRGKVQWVCPGKSDQIVCLNCSISGARMVIGEVRNIETHTTNSKLSLKTWNSISFTLRGIFTVILPMIQIP